MNYEAAKYVKQILRFKNVLRHISAVYASN